MTFVYQLFSNVMLATFPAQVIVVSIDPIDIDHSTVTTYFMVRKAMERKPFGSEGSLLTQGSLEDNEMSAGVR